MNDCRIYDKATSDTLDKLRSCIAEVEAGEQELRHVCRELHQLLTVIDGLLNVATFRLMEERLAMIRKEVEHGFECLEDAGIDGDSGRDAA
jgi:hypothetical protein